MKKVFTIAILSILCVCINAQNTSPCPGLKNPASFTAGSTSGLHVGYYTGQTGTKNNDAPNSITGTTGFTMNGTAINASALSSTLSGGSPSGCGSTLEPTKRFRIMSNTDGPGTGSLLGKDPIVTGGNLPYTPNALDPSITKSIRLGNCYVDGAEALYYNMRVSNSNSLVFIYYAINVENPTHGVTGNPAFIARVCRQNDAGQWVQISDTLCYAISSAGVANNVNGWHSYNGTSYYYREWNKVAINLIDYIYENVRLEFYIGDCVYNAHFGYCYIAGDCQAMEINTSGCPAGATTNVQTLTAPDGLDNYVWYRSNTDGRFISTLTNVSPDITFTQLTPNESTNNVYDCQIDDFMINEGEGAGTLTNNMVFRCDMTSAMDPAKPFISKVYVRVINTKPLMSIDTLKNCDSEVRLTNKSYVPNDIAGCDTSSSKWWFYEGSTNTTPVVDSAIGAVVRHQWDSSGHYAVRVRSYNKDDRACYTDSTYTIFALGRPNPVLELSAREVCDSEVVELRDLTPDAVRRDWIFTDETVLGNRNGNNQTIQKIFNNYKNPVELRTYNGLFSCDSINTYDTIWCTSSAFDTVEVFKHPELHVSGDTVVCNGQQTSITVATETEGCSYRWYRQLHGTNMISEGQTLTTLPYADTCKYYVKVISRQQCEVWDSVNAYRVNPKLTISRHDMCAGDSVTLTADAAYNYSWIATPADSTLDMLLDSAGIGPDVITVSPKETTVYSLIGHGTNGCNADPLTEQITIHPVPVATVEFTPDFVDSDNPQVTFTDASPYSVHRVWYFEDGIAEEYTSPCTHNFGEVSSDSVQVRLVAYNDLDCSDDTTFRLDVTQFTFFAPNIFTPERPDNNVFRIFTANKQENFSVYIYDRNGRQVFTSNDLNFTWDGTCEGIKCSQGTYAYVIRYRRPGTEDIVTQKGVVTLLR